MTPPQIHREGRVQEVAAPASGRSPRHGDCPPGWLAAISAAFRGIDGAFLGLPLLLLGVLAIGCRHTQIDLFVSSYFYCPDAAAWPLAEREPWATLYHCGCLPSLALGISGLVLAIAGSFYRPLRTWRRAGIFLALALAIGPGILVNAWLKPAVGRPRPFETAPFGGTKPFVAIGTELAGSESRSFPSGHAAMGFFLATPALLAYRRRPWGASAILAFGVAYGCLIGLARIAQGAHFLGDVIFAAFCVHLAALCALGVVALTDGRISKTGRASFSPTG